MTQIRPLVDDANRQIVYRVFALGTRLNDDGEEEMYDHTGEPGGLVQWLRNRVNWLAAQIAAGNEDVLHFLTMIDVDACNEELNAGSLTLCGITITIQPE